MTLWFFFLWKEKKMSSLLESTIYYHQYNIITANSSMRRCGGTEGGRLQSRAPGLFSCGSNSVCIIHNKTWTIFNWSLKEFLSFFVYKIWRQMTRNRLNVIFLFWNDPRVSLRGLPLWSVSRTCWSNAIYFIWFHKTGEKHVFFVWLFCLSVVFLFLLFFLLALFRLLIRI